MCTLRVTLRPTLSRDSQLFRYPSGTSRWRRVALMAMRCGSWHSCPACGPERGVSHAFAPSNSGTTPGSPLPRRGRSQYLPATASLRSLIHNVSLQFTSIFVHMEPESRYAPPHRLHFIAVQHGEHIPRRTHSSVRLPAAGSSGAAA